MEYDVTLLPGNANLSIPNIVRGIISNAQLSSAMRAMPPCRIAQVVGSGGSTTTLNISILQQ
jgi:hypothetical protein